MSYNGWTNRETWLINVWFNPESAEDVDFAREVLQEAIDNAQDFLRDFISDGEINWDELKEHFEEETDETVEDDANE